MKKKWIRDAVLICIKTKTWKIMRLNAFFLFLWMAQAWAISGYSQATKLTLKMSDSKIIEVLDEIEEQSEFYFLFNQKLVDVERKVDIDVQEKAIDAILQNLFAGTNVNHMVIDRQIVLTTFKPELLARQQPAVSGTVTDEAGQPLPGVTVVVKGTTRGTVTNADGNYTITGIPEDATLQFSFVGMRTHEVEVVGQTVIDVTMEIDAFGIEEVVAIGYGTQKRANLTGSVATVKNEELAKTPIASISNALAGRLPGLIVKQEQGAPGADQASINIRGFGTPLVIVDGIEQDFNTINPNEIESISVLKDASAAIYGARAGNGVILVTTKRGRIGRPTITLKSSYTLQGVTDLLKPVNAGQYAELMREYQLNSGIASDKTRFSEEDIQLYYDGTDPEGHPNTDWVDLALNDWSPMQEHNISMTGGSEKIKYYGFLGYLDQVGMFKSNNNVYKRYNVRMNVDANISENLSIGLDLSGIKGDLLRPSLDDKALWRSLYDATPVSHYAFPDPTKTPYAGMGNFNVLASSNIDKSGYIGNENNQINGTLSLNYKIPSINGLNLKALINYTQNTLENKTWTKQYDQWNYDFESNTYTYVKSSRPTSLEQMFTKSQLLTGQFSIDYNRVFKQNHTIKALLLYEFIDNNRYWFSAYRTNYITNAIDYLFAGGNEDQLADGSALETGRSSFVGRINYGYKGKYLLEVTTRYDGSPKFPKDKRWGFFPSVSAGWRISEEGFIKNSTPWIDNLKLRASMSRTGYDAVGAFQYLSGYQFSGNYAIGESVQQGLKSTGLSNPNITWETMTTYNTGIDFFVLNSKIYTEIDAFYRLREGMLANRQGSLPNTFGASLPAENINSQSNRGFEVLLGHKNNKGEFKYDISANVSWTRAKWEHYEEPEYTDPDQIRINKNTGKWTDLFYGYRSDGLFTSQEEIDNIEFDQDQKGNTTLQPGFIKYVDLNNDGVLDWKDKDIIGDGSVPRMMFGLNFNAKYKAFDFSVLFQGASEFNFRLSQINIESNRTPLVFLYENRWTQENNDPNALVAIQAINAKANNNQASDFDLYDATYLRIKNINLGYTLSGNWMRKIGVNHFRIYVAGTNLLTFSGLSKMGIDPEAIIENPNNLLRKGGYYYPQQKTITAGIEISL
jgi:TonB-linked SusC/RagA family outer membrane protein